MDSKPHLSYTLGPCNIYNTMSISLNFCSTYISYYILSISENRSYIELKLIVTEFSIHTIQYDYNFNSQHHSPTVTKFYLPQMAHKLDCSSSEYSSRLKTGTSPNSETFLVDHFRAEFQYFG